MFSLLAMPGGSECPFSVLTDPLTFLPHKRSLRMNVAVFAVRSDVKSLRFTVRRWHKENKSASRASVSSNRRREPGFRERHLSAGPGTLAARLQRYLRPGARWLN